MKDILPVEELARDERFIRLPFGERFNDRRSIKDSDRLTAGKLHPMDAGAPDSARAIMHGIFMGEVQALEGAGRTAWDFRSDAGTPFELKLDMARQCWDESRHVEISVKLLAHMGTQIGEFSESTFLYEAACNPDPVLRLCGVNRALEGLAIDVFNTMRDFGAEGGDPVLSLAEDWMLADEVTHVKMGSDWLRRLTERDPERRARALEFQRTVDKLFSFGGLRGESEENPIQLARTFRRLSGFSEEEIDDLAGVARESMEEAIARRKARLA
jgi:uncharacterized ferritin-like protein (DUF455 family)